MKHILALLVFSFSIAMLNSQSQQATIKIEKTEDGETVIIEKEVEIKDGQDFNSILQELGVLDNLGNVKEGQSFEINILKKDGLDSSEDITIEYYESPNFNFLSETKAFLGVMLSEHEGEGVRISSVIEGTKAEEAGLLPGDILISINGISYDNVGEFVRELGTHEPGEFVLLEYLRLGNKEEMEVELGEKAVSSYEKQLFLSPENLDFPNFNGDINIFEFSPENGESFQWNSNENSNKAFLGVSPGSNCTDQTKGVPIGQISPNSTAEEMGIKEGDIIEDINGEDVNTFNEIADLIGQMSPGDAIRVSITRDGKKEKLKGELGAKKSTGFDSYIFEGLPPLDNLDFDIQIDGNDSFGEELEIMIQKLEEQDFENLSDEELEFQIQQMLEPMLQNLGQVTESIRIGIVVMDITEEDLDQVNKNAEVGIKTEDDLDLEFINYFPNPLTSSLNLNFQLASEAPYKVLVYDQTGRTVFEDYRSITGEYANTIDLTGLASGPYFLQIVQGDNSYGRKLVKE